MGDGRSGGLSYGAVAKPVRIRARRVAPQNTGRSTISEPERRERGQRLLAVRGLSPELWARIDRECERRGMRLPALVRTALAEWLDDAS